jgi:leader peptidase (prepilin peptidase)/N-methyltransferase
MPHGLIIAFLFALGACVGSFINVVVYRLPLGRSVVNPPSACPKCGHRLAWFDNVPVLGWLMLRGKCRYCADPVSVRYPIVEFVCGALFAGAYALMFLQDVGPVTPVIEGLNSWGVASARHRPLDFLLDWPILVVTLVLIGSLLAASLIDAEHFIIPLSIPWLLFASALVIQGLFASPERAGSILIGPAWAMLVWATVGATLGWVVSLLALRSGLLKRSFAEGEPMLDREKASLEAGQPIQSAVEVREYSKSEIRREMLHEIVFVAPAVGLGVLGLMLGSRVGWFIESGITLTQTPLAMGLIGAMAGAIVAAGMVWITRILGSLAFGKEAMGMGDVHLMFGVGAAIGAGPSVVAFFLAPFAGMALSLYLLIFGRFRTIPYGPFLSIGSVLAVFCFRPVADHFAPGFSAIAESLRRLLVGG